MVLLDNLTEPSCRSTQTFVIPISIVNWAAAESEKTAEEKIILKGKIKSIQKKR